MNLFTYMNMTKQNTIRHTSILQHVQLHSSVEHCPIWVKIDARIWVQFKFVGLTGVYLKT